tara:strand:- start:21259 stop:22272 length:1014 start_codon:yes stop_codon:yes gene_type:complete
MGTPASEKPTILTACQPTSHFHLGNYLGAVRRWADMQDDYECFFGVVDLHAMTAPYTPADLRRNTLECAAQYIACGLDPKRSNIFVQSHVTGHTELAWILGCLAPLGQLERMTQFKDKSKRIGQSVGAGLFFYPVLQAADILLYNADAVPVGEDQKQHLELARDLAQKFNNTYSETFKLPEPLIGKKGARIMALQDPESKMSKSDKNQSSTLYLFEPKESIRKKVMSAVTDSGSEISASDDKPGVSNLMSILSSLTGHSYEEIAGQFSGKGYAPFKEAVAEAVIATVEPLQARYQELMKDKDALNTVLKEGAEVAQKRAYKMLAKVYRKAGLLERVR